MSKKSNNKPTAADFVAITDRLGFTASLSAPQRKSLANEVHVNVAFLRAAVRAVQTHPDLFAATTDVTDLAEDVDFVDVHTPLRTAAKAAERVIADEILVRKAAAARKALAVRDMVSAMSRTGKAGAVSQVLAELQRAQARRPRRKTDAAKKPATP